MIEKLKYNTTEEGRIKRKECSGVVHGVAAPTPLHSFIFILPSSFVFIYIIIPRGS